MMEAGHERYDELAAGYALDAISSRECREFELHAESCAVCAAAVASYASAASALSFTAPPRMPPAALRERVLNAVGAEKAAQPAARGHQRSAGWRHHPFRLAAAAVLVASLVTAGLLSLWLTQLLDEQARDDLILGRSYEALSVMAAADQRWPINGTDASAGAHGVVAYDAGAGMSSVVIWGLTEDGDPLYNVWVSDAGERTRVARLYASDGGFWAIMRRDLTLADGFGVTLVTADGQSIDMVDTILAAD